MNGSSALAFYLDAWREDSRRTPASLPREQARAAMLAAVASPPAAEHRTRALSFPRFRRRLHRRLLLAGSLAAAAAAIVVGVFGWNAPAGSALFGVRAAKQSVQLAIPGADLASLHLSFAEQSLSDARNGLNPAASLANAGMELQKAYAALPTDHSSRLWSRYGDDEAAYTRETSDLEQGDGAPAGGAPVVVPPATESPEGSATWTPRPSSHPTSEPTERATAEPTAHPEASPSGYPGSDGTWAPPTGAPSDH